MNEDAQIQSDWTVDQTLEQRPELSSFFVKHHMQCVGCYMQKFCTIKDVSEIYQVNLGEFLKSLNEFEVKNQN
jgi:hybrid cluster-associated redox disulfide protein